MLVLVVVCLVLFSLVFIVGFLLCFVVLGGVFSAEDGRKEMFYLTTHSTHFICGCMASDMVKDHSDSEKGNLLPPHSCSF